MSNDIDFEQFIKLLDGALASDDKNVKQALRKFLFVAAMVMGDDCEPGPFTRMMETMDALQRRVATLEKTNTFTTTDGNLYGTPYSTPTTGTGTIPPFIPTSTTGTTWTSGSVKCSGGSAFTNTAGNSTTTTVTGLATGTTVTIPSQQISPSNWTAPYNVTTTPGGTTSTLLWEDFSDPQDGTNIKNEIKESLEKLAKAS